MRSGRFCLSVLVVLGVAVSCAGAVPRSPRLRSVRTWALAIGNGDLVGKLNSRYAAYDLLVIDGQEATARQVQALRRTGRLVLAYLDVGTIEPGRPWYHAASRYRLDFWPDWGEYYADVAAPGYRSLISHTVAPSMLRKGFDGLFLDNTDMVETHPHLSHGMRTLVRALARLVHSANKFLFTQNGEASVGPLLSSLDGWNREDVSATYDFAGHRYVRQPHSETAAADRALRRMARAGLLTLATDYTAAGDAAGEQLAVRNACRNGALPFVSDIDLKRVPAVAARCG